MKTRTGTLATVLIAACAVIARADTPTYLRPAAIDPLKLLPGPPSAHSAEAREELDLMLMIQEKRTPAEVDRCASEVKLKVEAFKSVMGPWFTSKNLPRLAKLFAALEKDSKQLSDAVKAHYRRPRPEHEDDHIHVPIDDETTFAYPSGHSTRGTLYALILVELAPDHRDALLDRGREIGWDRVIAGLHHPSDIYAGRVLGQAIAQSLLADPKFQPELAAIKTELHDAQERAAEPAASR
ncbi:MAG TPA: phosphatase PAP2 family protein [Pirellulales bacterium]|jgi:acid phosphatase (class A)|nr:phosphatase PAP2 family protein [Pirellulales bacterium]